MITLISCTSGRIYFLQEERCAIQYDFIQPKTLPSQWKPWSNKTWKLLVGVYLFVLSLRS